MYSAVARVSIGAFTGIALAVTLLAGGAGAAQARTIETIVQDDALLLHGSDEEVRTGLERARALGMTRVRLTAGWSVMAPDPNSTVRPDFDAENPSAYPPDVWNNLDRAVRLAREAGLASMIDIAFWAPRWATKDDGADRLAAEVDPSAYAHFAKAVATRYSGNYTPPRIVASTPPLRPSPDRDFLEQLLATKPPKPEELPAVLEAPKVLPAVDIFTIWNEPNHPGFLRPQWLKTADGAWSVRSAEIYREMVRAAYPAIKSGAPGSRVLIGGTASMGSSTPGLSGVPPLRFLRALACVDDALRPVTAGTCAGYEPLPGDGWSHHPYSLRTTPGVDTRDTDKAPVAATGRLAATLRALVAGKRLAPQVAEIWLTEYGYETNAPDPRAPFRLDEQGPLLAWAEYLGTKEPAVRSWPQFQLYDRPNGAPRPGSREFGDWQSGLYFSDGSPKPSAATYAMPVFASCLPRRGGRWAVVWGRMRTLTSAGTAEVQVQDAKRGWLALTSYDRPARKPPVGRMSVAGVPGDAVTRYVKHRRGAGYRLRWTGPDGEHISAVARPDAARCRPGKRAAASR